MKKQIRAFLVGGIVASVLMTSVGFAGAIREKIEVIFNSINITVDGDSVKADNILYDGTTYVPLRNIAEMIGKDVGWDEKTKTASIGEAKAPSNIKPSGNYSRDNPAPVGVTQRYTNEYVVNSGTYGSTMDITIKEVLRGDEAIKKVIKDKGHEPYVEDYNDLVLVKVNKKLVDTLVDEKISISAGSFDTFTKKNVEIFQRHNSVTIGTKDGFKNTTLYEGSEYEGYISYLIPKEEKNPKLAYIKRGEVELWFELFERI